MEKASGFLLVAALVVLLAAASLVIAPFEPLAGLEPGPKQTATASPPSLALPSQGEPLCEVAGGCEAWVALFEGSRSSRAVGIASHPSEGTVFVTGCSPCSGAADILTIAYNSTDGQVLWQARYEGPRGSVPASLAMHPEGHTVFLTGRTDVSEDPQDLRMMFATVAYDTGTGAERWSTMSSGPAGFRDLPSDLVVHPEGALVYVAGTSQSAHGSTAMLVALDPETGQPVWEQHYEGSDGTGGRVALAVSAQDGLVAAAGRAYEEGDSRYFVAVYEAGSGEQAWAAGYSPSPTGSATAYDVVFSPDGGRVFLTGASSEEGLPSDDDYATLAYDVQTGEQVWVARYDGPAEGQDIAEALAVDSEGTTVFVTGSSQDEAGYREQTTVAYDAASGVQLWADRYGGLSGGSGEALVLGPDDERVFVTGFVSMGPAGRSYVTQAYDAGTGERTWTARFDSSEPRGGAQGVDIATVHDGRRIVTTGFTNEGGSHAYATLAYDLDPESLNPAPWWLQDRPSAWA